MKHATGDAPANPTLATARRRRVNRPQAAETSLKPLQRPNLVQEAVERLREQIIAGVFGIDGAIPPEGQLGQALGVSRTVIREAMRILAAQGLVEVSQGRQSRVKPANAQTVIDTFNTYLQREDHSLLNLVEVRRPLEAAIAELAAKRATPADIEQLEESIRRQIAASKKADQIEEDLRFHDLLAVATNNPVFLVLLRAVAGLMRRSRQETLVKTGVERSVLGHRTMLDAIKAHDADAARQAMLEHISHAEHDLREKDR